MAISRIDSARTNTQALQNDQAQAAQDAQKLELFQKEVLDKSPVVKLTDGSTLRLPVSEDSQSTAAMSADLQALPADKASKLMGAVGELVTAIRGEARSGAELGSVSSSLQTITESTMGTALETLGLNGKEQGDAVRTVMAMGMGSVNDDLAGYAYKVQGKTNQASETRDEIRDLRDVISDDEWPQEFDYTEMSFDEQGNMTIETKTVTLNSKEDAENLLGDLEGKLNSLRDFTEMDTLELQNMYQEQQRVMNIFTAILEMMHKTQQAMINNLKA